jgi:hypothetical protein
MWPSQFDMFKDNLADKYNIMRIILTKKTLLNWLLNCLLTQLRFILPWFNWFGNNWETRMTFKKNMSMNWRKNVKIETKKIIKKEEIRWAGGFLNSEATNSFPRIFFREN